MEMTFEQAAKIANDLLDSFQLLFSIEPLRLSTCSQNIRTKVKTFTILPNKVVLTGSLPFRKRKKRSILSILGSKTDATSDEFHLDIIYKLIRNNRCFEITLFDDPDYLGYCSMLPDYNPYSYVVCNIVEKRPNGEKKYEMCFGFDIEKSTFLELFEVVHYNTVGIRREYPNLNCRLESELKDVVIL